MRLKARIKRDWRFWKGLSRTLKRVKTIARDSDNLICDDIQAAVDHWRDNPAMTFEGRTVTYGELDAMANRYAHWAKGLNLRRGQTDFLATPDTGFVIQLNDQKAFNEAVQSLRDAPERCKAVGRHNLDRVEDFFIERCAQAYEQVFDAALAARLEHQ